MTSVLFSSLKFIILTIAILIAGQWIEWNGKNLSEHTSELLKVAQKSDSYHQVQNWSKDLLKDSRSSTDRKLFEEKASQNKAAGAGNTALRRPNSGASQDEISPSDREQIKSLIKGL